MAAGQNGSLHCLSGAKELYRVKAEEWNGRIVTGTNIQMLLGKENYFSCVSEQPPVSRTMTLSESRGAADLYQNENQLRLTATVGGGGGYKKATSGQIDFWFSRQGDGKTLFFPSNKWC